MGGSLKRDPTRGTICDEAKLLVFSPCCWLVDLFSRVKIRILLTWLNRLVVNVADVFSSSLDRLARTADIVIIMVKAPETSRAAEVAKKIAKTDTGIVVTLQNGFGGKDKVDQALSEDLSNKVSQ